MYTVAVVDDPKPGTTNDRWFSVEVTSTVDGFVKIGARDHASAAKMAKAIHRAINNGDDNPFRADIEDRTDPETRT